MKIAITGGTGLIGRYIIRQLSSESHSIRAWKRDSSVLTGIDEPVEWILGDLTDEQSMLRLVEGCDAVVHSALWKPGEKFQGGEGPLPRFATVNVVGTLSLIEAAMKAGVQRFVHLSSCAVYDKILDDRPLDEAHPAWPRSHYGALKAAIEPFIRSLATTDDFNICALRPTAVYGTHYPIQQSKWFDLIQAVARGEKVPVARGSKEVHAADVAKAISILLQAPKQEVAGESFNCVDRYISQFKVASIAKQLSGSAATIDGQETSPKHQIATGKIERLGMEFGGDEILNETIGQLLTHSG